MSDEQGLAGWLVQPLAQTLAEVCRRMVVLAPPGALAVVTVLEDAGPPTAAASSGTALQLAALESELEEGPRLTALMSGNVVSTGNLGGDRRWPRFGPRAGRGGLASAHCSPLLAAGRPFGAVELFAASRDAFASLAVEPFTAQAAISIANAHLLARAERLAAQLQESMATRAVIDQAVGVVMARTGVPAAQALEQLRAMSTAQAKKLVLVATELVEEAGRTARARLGRP